MYFFKKRPRKQNILANVFKIIKLLLPLLLIERSQYTKF